MRRLDDHVLLLVAIVGFVTLLLPESKLEVIRLAFLSLFGVVK